jgi:CRISPR/Cas system CMR subunit Cmr4 (Cas7 group RAMP superfamily)
MVASGLPVVGSVVVLVAMTAPVPSQGTTMGAPAMVTCPRVLHRIAEHTQESLGKDMKKYELSISLEPRGSNWLFLFSSLGGG